jgi:hypothetical protein
MSTKDLPEGKRRPVRKADNLTAVCELIVYKLWEPPYLISLWASTACYRDRLAFFFFFLQTTPFHYSVFITCTYALSHSIYVYIYIFRVYTKGSTYSQSNFNIITSNTEKLMQRLLHTLSYIYDAHYLRNEIDCCLVGLCGSRLYKPGHVCIIETIVQIFHRIMTDHSNLLSWSKCFKRIISNLYIWYKTQSFLVCIHCLNRRLNIVMCMSDCRCVLDWR